MEERFYKIRKPFELLTIGILLLGTGVYGSLYYLYEGFKINGTASFSTSQLYISLLTTIPFILMEFFYIRFLLIRVGIKLTDFGIIDNQNLFGTLRISWQAIEDIKCVEKNSSYVLLVIPKDEVIDRLDYIRKFIYKGRKKRGTAVEIPLKRLIVPIDTFINDLSEVLKGKDDT